MKKEDFIEKNVPDELIEISYQKAKEHLEKEKKWNLEGGVKKMFDRETQLKILQTNIIGEILFSQLLKESNIQFEESNLFLQRFSHKIGNERINVKVLGRKVYPLPHYWVEVNAPVLYYDMDVFIFASYNTETKVITFLGWKTKNDFFKKAGLCLKGTERNGFICKGDKYEMHIYDINPIKTYLQEHNGKN